MPFGTAQISWKRITIVWVVLAILFGVVVIGVAIPGMCAAMYIERGIDDDEERVPPAGLSGTYPPQWSVDGTNILFGSSMVEIGADGTNIEAVRDAIHGNFSPDGKQIAFATLRHGDNWDIGVSNLDGSNYRRLTKAEFSEFNPLWSPDSSRMVFISDGLYIMDIDGSDVKRLVDGAFAIGLQAWSPDGRTLAFLSLELHPSRRIEDSRWHIHTVGAGTSNLTRLAESAPVPPAWSPDGSTIAFLSKDGLSVFRINPDGSGLREIANIDTKSLPSRRPNQTWRLSWSPDGSEILLQDYPFIRVKTDGSGYGVFSGLGWAKDADAFWSPDGSRIAVYITKYHDSENYDSKRVSLFTMARDGTDKGALVTSHAGPPDERGWREAWLEPAYGESVDRLTHWKWHDAQSRLITGGESSLLTGPIGAGDGKRDGI
jgi:Tol biopolymer transport system component